MLVGLVIAWRMRSMARFRPINPARLWLVPALYTLVVVLALVSHPPGLVGWGLFVLALALGSALGWQRGRFTLIERDGAGGGLMMRQSPAGLLLIVGVIVVRQVARSAATQGGGAHGPGVWLVTDAMLGFALGFMAVFRLELGLRAQRL